MPARQDGMPYHTDKGRKHCPMWGTRRKDSRVSGRIASHLDNRWLPHKGSIHVGDPTSVDIDAKVLTRPVRHGVLLSQLVEDVGGIEPGIVAELAGDDLQGLGKSIDEELTLARDGAGMLAKEARNLLSRGPRGTLSSGSFSSVEQSAWEWEKQGEGERWGSDTHFEVNGTASGDDRCILHGAAYDHDRIVEGPLGLVDELLTPSAQHHSAGLGSGAAGEQVVALSANLLLLKHSTGPEDGGEQIVHCGLQHRSCGAGDAADILLCHLQNNTTRT